MPVLSFRYRLLPTKRQHRALEGIRESQRVLYNAALEERIDAYRKAGLVRNYMDQTKALTEWRAEDPEARSLPVGLQRGTLKRLDNAFQGFFRRVKAGQSPGFPRFRGRGRWDGFAFREMLGISFSGARIRFKGMPGTLRVHMHRPLPESGVLKNATFVEARGRWSVSFAVEIPGAPPRPPNRAVGVDLGVATFAALSDGGFIPNLRAAREAEHELRSAQRALARKKRGSRGYARARRALRAVHAVIRRRRSEFLHQASARLIRDYDVIALESMNVGALARSKLARDVADASWGRFVSMLRYKAECAGVRMVEVSNHDTSQLCSACGERVGKDLGIRTHECPRCGLSMDRDLNAARNILIRAGVGPGALNVAGLRGKRARKNIGPTGPSHCPGSTPT